MSEQGFQLMDARRGREQDLVAIKTFRKDSQESRIARFLSSLHDPLNHTVSVFQVLDDPHDRMMDVPFLRPIHDQDFTTGGGAIDFVGQMLGACPPRIAVDRELTTTQGLHGDPFKTGLTVGFAIAPNGAEGDVENPGDRVQGQAVPNEQGAGGTWEDVVENGVSVSV
ncbi:hypothetical protein BD413DRAFT_611910 [Trametes elegans]|nr:hypothetical protein BD413DRAFT_611910 [Trametes elegans]